MKDLSPRHATRLHTVTAAEFKPHTHTRKYVRTHIHKHYNPLKLGRHPIPTWAEQATTQITHKHGEGDTDSSSSRGTHVLEDLTWVRGVEWLQVKVWVKGFDGDPPACKRRPVPLKTLLFFFYITGSESGNNIPSSPVWEIRGHFPEENFIVQRLLFYSSGENFKRGGGKNCRKN